MAKEGIFAGDERLSHELKRLIFLVYRDEFGAKVPRTQPQGVWQKIN
jgi:hypothetical protein